MSKDVSLIAALVLAGMSMPAFADDFTSKVVSINGTGALLLADRSTITPDQKMVEGKLEVGATIRVIFNGTENGYDPLEKVVVVAAPAIKPPA